MYSGHFTDGRNGYTIFSYKRHPARYDGGSVLIVSYYRNDEYPESLENHTLDSDPHLSPQFIYDEILQGGRWAHDIARLTLRTIDGRPTLIEEDPLRFPPFPPNLDLPRLPLAALHREDTLLDMSVDLVSVEGTFYAFKFHDISPGQLPLESDRADIADELVEEVETLSRLHSPFIIRPAFAIHDADDHFRGYLTPYYPAGSLEQVLSDLHQENQPKSIVLHPIGVETLLGEVETAPLGLEMLLAWDSGQPKL